MPRRSCVTRRDPKRLGQCGEACGDKACGCTFSVVGCMWCGICGCSMWCSLVWYEKTCCSPPAPPSIFVEGGADLLSIFVPRVNTGWQSLRTSEVFVFFGKHSHRPLCRSLTNTCGNTWVRLIGCPDMGCGLRGLLRGPSSPLHLPLASLPGSTSTGPPTQRY